MPKLEEHVRLYAELKERLKAEFPDIDEETLSDTAEGGSDLHETLMWLCRKAVEKEAFADALADMIAGMTARKARFIAGADHLRGLALWAMGEADIPKITAPDLTVSIGKGRTKVIISDIEKIPQHLCTFIAKPDTKAIREEIESGTDVPGASISNQQPVLSIRTK